MIQRIKRGMAMLLGMVLTAAICVSALPQISLTVYAAGTGKNLQLVTGDSAPNVEGAQASSVYFGNYKQSSDGVGGYNTEPIKWRVLQNSGAQLFLLADQALDGKQYHNSSTSITWEGSAIRTWLNGTSFKRTVFK